MARRVGQGSLRAAIAVASLAVVSAFAPQRDSRALSPTARHMQAAGYVNVEDEDSTIFVSLMYSREDNFTGGILYTDLREAYLHPKAMAALRRAQQHLKELRPDLSIIVFDAARPMSVQQTMWDKVKNTSKNIYVSNPANGGGMHNYGLAVDISLCTLDGDTIPMGTKIDYMGAAAHTDREDALVTSGTITAEARNNRRLMRQVMESAGFTQLRTEWWHYNLVSRATAKKYYKAIP